MITFFKTRNDPHIGNYIQVILQIGLVWLSYRPDFYVTAL